MAPSLYGKLSHDPHVIGPLAEIPQNIKLDKDGKKGDLYGSCTACVPCHLLQVPQSHFHRENTRARKRQKSRQPRGSPNASADRRGRGRGHRARGLSGCVLYDKFRYSHISGGHGSRYDVSSAFSGSFRPKNFDISTSAPVIGTGRCRFWS